MNIADTLIFIKSHEKGLVTKEHIVMATHLIFAFKWAVHFINTLAVKLFNSGTKLF